ncbi:MAG: MFS transporter [Lacunisphaera sp.]|nr:MFS transporter [Lacunisphaera sp.]
MTTPTYARNPGAQYPLLSAAWIAVAVLWLAGGSNYLTRTMLTTMRGSILEEIPMSDAQFGLLTSGFLWVYAFASPVAGFFADRFSRRRVIIISVFAWSAITLLTAYVKTFEQFFALRTLLGLSQACYIPAAVALIIDYHRGSTRALAAGIHVTGTVAGSTLGAAGGWLAAEQGWSQAYEIIALPNLALGVVLCFFLRDPSREGVAEPAVGGGLPGIRLGEALLSLARPGPFYAMMAFSLVQGAVSWMIIGWMPTQMREQFAMGQGAAGFSALGFLYFMQIVGLLAGGYWSDRLSLVNPRARIILPALAIMCAAPVFFLTGWFPMLAFTLLSLSLWGLAVGIAGANLMPIICLTVDTRYRATAMGVSNLCAAVSGGLAVYGAGALRDAKIGVNFILTFAGFGAVLCALSLWLVNVGLNMAEKKKNGS